MRRKNIHLGLPIVFVGQEGPIVPEVHGVSWWHLLRPVVLYAMIFENAVWATLWTAMFEVVGETYDFVERSVLVVWSSENR